MRMGHLKHSGLDWMVGMLIAKLSVVYKQITFNLTLRFSYIGVICITLRITVQLILITMKIIIITSIYYLRKRPPSNPKQTES